MISWGDHRTGKFKLELTRSEKFHKCNCYYFQHNCVVPMWCEFAPTAVRLAYPVKTVQFTLNIVRGVVVVVLQLNEKKEKSIDIWAKLFFSFLRFMSVMRCPFSTVPAGTRWSDTEFTHTPLLQIRFSFSEMGMCSMVWLWSCNLPFDYVLRLSKLLL